MKLSRFRLLAGFFILALVLVDVAARPTSLQDRAVLPAKNGRNLEDNSPLALDRREDLTSRSSTGPDHPQSPDAEGATNSESSSGLSALTPCLQRHPCHCIP